MIFGQEDASLADVNRRDDLLFTPEISLEDDISLKQITRRAVRELEYKIISRVLLKHHGNRTNAARALKISYRALMYKIRDSGIPRLRAFAAKQVIESPIEMSADLNEQPERTGERNRRCWRQSVNFRTPCFLLNESSTLGCRDLQKDFCPGSPRDI